MIKHSYFQVSPDDDRNDVAHLLGKGGLDVVPLVAITVWSAIVYSITPILLKKLGIDLAVMSVPFIATFIDGTGLIIYFKIAQHILHI